MRWKEGSLEGLGEWDGEVLRGVEGWREYLF